MDVRFDVGSSVTADLKHRKELIKKFIQWDYCAMVGLEIDNQIYDIVYPDGLKSNKWFRCCHPTKYPRKGPSLEENSEVKITELSRNIFLCIGDSDNTLALEYAHKALGLNERLKGVTQIKDSRGILHFVPPNDFLTRQLAFAYAMNNSFDQSCSVLRSIDVLRRRNIDYLGQAICELRKIIKGEGDVDEISRLLVLAEKFEVTEKARSDVWSVNEYPPSNIKWSIKTIKGMVSYFQGNFAKAVDQFSKAIKLIPLFSKTDHSGGGDLCMQDMRRILLEVRLAEAYLADQRFGDAYALASSIGSIAPSWLKDSAIPYFINHDVYCYRGRKEVVVDCIKEFALEHQSEDRGVSRVPVPYNYQSSMAVRPESTGSSTDGIFEFMEKIQKIPEAYRQGRVKEASHIGGLLMREIAKSNLPKSEKTKLLDKLNETEKEARFNFAMSLGEK